MILLGLLAAATACEPVAELPEALSVAWVSKVPATAGNHTALEVVTLDALRASIARNGRDATATLRTLGLLSRKQPMRAAYKVTVFEVARSTLCRPMAGTPGELVAGIPICDTPEQKQGAGVKTAAYSGCGYGTDLGAGVRGLDTFRIEWGDAVRNGFCVLPLERLVAAG